MIYDLYVNFVGGGNEEFVTMLANSPTMQKCFAVCSLAFSCFALVVFAYMLIVIFRGWK